MNFLKWTAALAAIAFLGWVLVNDAREQVRAAEAMAWYRHAQEGEHKQHGKKEWKAFKECIEIGERVRECINQLD